MQILKWLPAELRMTKFANAGQMCVAPDYVLVHNSVREQFVKTLKETVLKFFLRIHQPIIITVRSLMKSSSTG